jgi:6,7-dimethyl-8-ribityllumazine synthase
MKVLEGKLDATGKNFGIVVSRFNSNVTRLLLEGAVECLEEHGARSEDITVIWVPGAAEIPQALLRLRDMKAPTFPPSPYFDALIALGCVIRGETAHFDAVVRLAAEGFARAANGDVPMAFGVLTTENLEQAMERTGQGAGNKGWEAALAALEMSGLWRELNQEQYRIREGQE